MRGAAGPNGAVLIVEHDPDLQTQLARMLAREGRRVVAAASCDGALALLSAWAVDLVLVAEDLPGVDGLELVRDLRAVAPTTPMVLMAEHVHDAQLVARLAGAVACLVKPFQLEALREILGSLPLAQPAT